MDLQVMFFQSYLGRSEIPIQQVIQRSSLIVSIRFIIGYVFRNLIYRLIGGKFSFVGAHFTSSRIKK